MRPAGEARVGQDGLLGQIRVPRRGMGVGGCLDRESAGSARTVSAPPSEAEGHPPGRWVGRAFLRGPGSLRRA